MHTIKELVDECERIKRNEAPIDNKQSNEDGNNKNSKQKSKFGKSEKTNKKSDRSSGGAEDGQMEKNFYCSKCGAHHKQQNWPLLHS